MTDLIDRAKAFYRDVLTDPQQASAVYLADDFVLENYLPEHIPFGGRYEGREGMVRYLTEIANAIDMGPLEIEGWVAGQGSVVLRGEEESVVHSTGKSYRMRFVHWLDFDDSGCITRMCEYNDTAEMGGAF